MSDGFDGFTLGGFIWGGGNSSNLDWVINYDGATTVTYTVGVTSPEFIYSCEFITYNGAQLQGSGLLSNGIVYDNAIGFLITDYEISALFYDQIFGMRFPIDNNKLYKFEIESSGKHVNVRINDLLFVFYEDISGPTVHVDQFTTGALYDHKTDITDRYFLGQCYNNSLRLYNTDEIAAEDIVSSKTKPTSNQVVNIVGTSGDIDTHGSVSNNWIEKNNNVYVNDYKKYIPNFDRYTYVNCGLFAYLGQFELLIRMSFDDVSVDQFIGQYSRSGINNFPATLNSLCVGSKNGKFAYAINKTGLLVTSIPIEAGRIYDIKIERSGTLSSTVKFTVNSEGKPEQTSTLNSLITVSGVLICNEFYLGDFGNAEKLYSEHYVRFKGTIYSLKSRNDSNVYYSNFRFNVYNISKSYPSDVFLRSDNPLNSGVITSVNDRWIEE